MGGGAEGGADGTLREQVVVGHVPWELAWRERHVVHGHW